MLRSILITTLFVCCGSVLFSQISSIDTTTVYADTTGLTIQSLAVPSTPAFLLLGIEPSSIETPKDPKDFAVAIANATQTFSTIPQSFAMEFSPFIILKKNRIDYSNYISNKNIFNNIYQTLSISLATSTLDSVPGVSPIISEVSVAAKFSILRGKVNNETLQKLYTIDTTIAALNIDNYHDVDKYITSNPQYQKQLIKIGTLGDDTLKIQQAEMSLDSLSKSLTKNYSAQNQEFNSLKSQASGITLERVGFKLDAAAGLVYDFPFQKVDSSSLHKLGAWITGGWNIAADGQDKPGWNFLGSARVLHNLDQLTVMSDGTRETGDNLFVDLGGKIEYTKANKIALSLEYLQRFTPENDNIDPTYRLAFNGNYQVSPNYNLSLTLGRNFDGTISKSGNLLSALHLFGTFGNRKTNTAVTKT